MPTTRDFSFSCLRRRLCAAGPEATCMSSAGHPTQRSLIPFSAPLSSLVNFLLLSPTSPLPQPLFQTGLLTSWRSTFLVLALIFNLTWSLHSFSSMWKSSFIISIHRVEKPSNSPVSFQPTSLPASQSWFSLSFYHFILSPHQPWLVYTSSNSFSFSFHIEWL